MVKIVPGTARAAGNLTNRPMVKKRQSENRCDRCASPMEQIELGYFSCPVCHYQLVEAHSGFWVDWLTPEEKSNAEASQAK